MTIVAILRELTLVGDCRRVAIEGGHDAGMGSPGADTFAARQRVLRPVCPTIH